MNHAERGIVHVVGPQLGLTQSGTTVVCGDSRTSTHGAFGAMAFGIGTSKVEHGQERPHPPRVAARGRRDGRGRHPELA